MSETGTSDYCWNPLCSNPSNPSVKYVEPTPNPEYVIAPVGEPVFQITAGMIRDIMRQSVREAMEEVFDEMLDRMVSEMEKKIAEQRGETGGD